MMVGPLSGLPVTRQVLSLKSPLEKGGYGGFSQREAPPTVFS